MRLFQKVRQMRAVDYLQTGEQTHETNGDDPVNTDRITLAGRAVARQWLGPGFRQGTDRCQCWGCAGASRHPQPGPTRFVPGASDAHPGHPRPAGASGLSGLEEFTPEREQKKDLGLLPAHYRRRQAFQLADNHNARAKRALWLSASTFRGMPQKGGDYPLMCFRRGQRCTQPSREGIDLIKYVQGRMSGFRADGGRF